MNRVRKLRPDELYHRCDPNQFSFKTTDELVDLDQFLGQSRAIDAIHFGIHIKHEGYNLYAMGPSGIGKHSVIETILNNEASQLSTPYDWCYVHNFNDPTKPIAISLPPGWGIKLRDDMNLLVEDLIISIPAIFESEEYRNRIQKITDEYNEKQEEAFKSLEQEAQEHQLIILSTQQGFIVSPIGDQGEEISQEKFSQLSPAEQESRNADIKKLTKRLDQFLKEVPHFYRERRKKIQELQNEFTMTAVWYLINDLKQKYRAFPAVLDYLRDMQQDVVIHVKDFLKSDEEKQTLPIAHLKLGLARYQINVLVNHDSIQGAPVIYEDNPSYENLIGHMEQIAQLGTLTTDFSLIRPGALHRANGGFLMLDIRHLLQQSYSWEVLKRTLYARKITIEPLSHMLGFFTSTSLEPQPIPLDIKVILLGDRASYSLLLELDPDFKELFKVSVDFEEQIPRDENNLQLFARLIATLARQEKLKPFDRSAVARIIEHSSRLVDDKKKLSVHIRNVTDLLREGDYWANAAGHEVTSAGDIQRALDSHTHRVDQYRTRIYEEINRNILMIDTTGQVVGQVNGISVLQVADFTFGQPSRITASTHSGKGEIIDIEREVDLGGALHTKGVLILGGFLNGRYLTDSSLSLSASLAFEQNYSTIEGDSASVGELCAILSSLANTPIKQTLAVTGSINQRGQVQAIGNINEKIEGFFAICKSRGLTGDQGVIIPAANVQHLMLDEAIVSAVAANLFHVYPVENVDEAISILTGVEAGQRNKEGKFPADTINFRVETRLREFTEKAKKED